VNEPGLCPSCGRVLDVHDRHIRFQLPDVVWEMNEEERKTRGFWSTPEDRANLVAVKEHGFFVRSLLPVHLVGGDSVTFGAWFAVDEATWSRVIDVWWAPEYARLEFVGELANAIAPWGDEVAGRSARARVRAEDEIPWVSGSEDPVLGRLLREEWPTEPVLGAWSDAWG
jgi:hypothetical protein